MIDLGISKLALIGVVALVVIGPEKLPKVARMAGSLFGRAQRYINQVKAEVGREMELDELRKMRQDVQDAALGVENEIARNLTQADEYLQGVSRDMYDDGYAEYKARQAPNLDQIAAKVRDFRKKKLLRTSAIPAWYKQRHARKTRVMSAAARVAKYRPQSGRPTSFF